MNKDSYSPRNNSQQPLLVKRPRTLARSLFKEESHYHSAEKILEAALSNKIPSKPEADGSLHIFEALDILSREDENLDYLNYNHLIEVYLRHSPIMFYIRSDEKEDFLVSMRPKTAGLPIVPPDVLYFGTLSGVAGQAMSRGLTSNKHACVILTDDRDQAEARAYGFSKEKDAPPALIIVDAKSAVKNGTCFLGGDREHFYKTELISRAYLTRVDLD